MTIVVVLSAVSALVLVAAGAALIATATETEVHDAMALDSPGAVRATGAVVGLLGVVEGVMVVLLARGREFARSAFGVFNTVHVATAVYGLLALRDLEASSVSALTLPVIVLWFLYGDERSVAFFDA